VIITGDQPSPSPSPSPAPVNPVQTGSLSAASTATHECIHRMCRAALYEQSAGAHTVCAAHMGSQDQPDSGHHAGMPRRGKSPVLELMRCSECACLSTNNSRPLHHCKTNVQGPHMLRPLVTARNPTSVSSIAAGLETSRTTWQSPHQQCVSVAVTHRWNDQSLLMAGNSLRWQLAVHSLGSMTMPHITPLITLRRPPDPHAHHTACQAQSGRTACVSSSLMATHNGRTLLSHTHISHLLQTAMASPDTTQHHQSPH
jgi:hypothetical protein